MVEESAKSFATCLVGSVRISGWAGERSAGGGHYLSDTADVLVAVLFGKAQVLVEPETHIVTVEPVSGQADVEQVLLKGGRDGRLARGR